MEIFRIAFTLLIINITIVVGGNFSRLVLENEIVNNILEAMANKARIRPTDSSQNKPVNVTINFDVRKLMRIDDVKNEYEVQLTFRQRWFDERLKFNDHDGKLHYLSVSNINKLWIPDLFFKDELDGRIHDLLVPNYYFRIFPDGNVLYSMRISLTLFCPMNLRWYPFDTQVCPLKISSWRYTTDDVLLQWREPEPVVVYGAEASTSNFNVKVHSTEYCSRRSIAPEYSCLVANLNFKRYSFHYLLHVYIPLALLIVTSWISFWLKASSIRSRLIISVGTSFCVLLQLYSNSIYFISLHYFTALDIWAIICFTSVLGALAENLYVDYSLTQQIKVKPTLDKGKEGEKNQVEAIHAGFIWVKMSDQTLKIDAVSRVAFPLLFFLMNVIYWPLILV